MCVSREFVECVCLSREFVCTCMCVYQACVCVQTLQYVCVKRVCTVSVGV